MIASKWDDVAVADITKRVRRGQHMTGGNIRITFATRAKNGMSYNPGEQLL